MPDYHEEELLGKAYDGRLMARLLTFLGPYLTKVAIEDYIAQGDLAGLKLIAGLYVLALLVQFVLSYLQVYVMNLTGQRIMFDMRREIFGHLQKLHPAFFDRNPVGRLVTRVTADVDALNELFTSGVVTMFGDIFMLVGIMVVLISLNLKLALVSFAVPPPSLRSPSCSRNAFVRPTVGYVPG